ncbi:hypothetical protein [Aliagarivorans marinus]|uniref:hypothetical protein n=1 Tax=Aliagarivorans marinus TaxID=561965 RepID=UPI00041335DB|nr:hypothetical protein [Aliagarivorans marinus]
MKKLLCSALLLGASTVVPAHALTLELDGNLASTSSSSSSWQGDMSARLRHGIPLFPNVGITAANRSQGDAFDGSRVQFELFYNLVESFAWELDLGLAYERWNADKKHLAGVGSGEQLYASGRFSWLFPASNLGVMADMQYPLTHEDFKREQWRVGLSYRFNEHPQLTFNAGFQWEELKTRWAKNDRSGPFMGVNLRF